ncbi:sulfur carrier protein ThiS,thiamine biosynthesis protein ThiS,ThiS family [Burkholderia stabilis]|uniref:Sulfur carrier protein ThiS,thiamine biosynthesis protein ThiS,ThiS family n=14 Tax=Burkholderia TaxID=32008 RepID=A0AAJ5T414_9BURK|nr:sulfur carrier protein ThiS,thiamine biosynthesis protein ThiS,ThiS family [Burkholderia stabilis]
MRAADRIRRSLMDIQINQQTLTLPDGATVADALAAYGARPPYAVALNGNFVARTQHAARALAAGDKLDVVHPVAGG